MKIKWFIMFCIFLSKLVAGENSQLVQYEKDYNFPSGFALSRVTKKEIKIAIYFFKGDNCNLFKSSKELMFCEKKIVISKNKELSEIETALKHRTLIKKDITTISGHEQAIGAHHIIIDDGSKKLKYVILYKIHDNLGATHALLRNLVTSGNSDPREPALSLFNYFSSLFEKRN